MQFTTPITIAQGAPQIDYTSRVLSLGSCFAVNMGQKLDYFKFRNTTNPFGILFHPLAIEQSISFGLYQKKFTGDDVFYQNERWHSFDAHSDISAAGKEVVLQNLNQAVESVSAELRSATHVIITLGTAWAYRRKKTGSLVANCHKVPQTEFVKELLPVDVICQSLQNILSLIGQVNNGAKVIFTVSPVRHIKDGFTENQRSKAHLITALHEVVQTPAMAVGGLYFPAYEIMMDELRDYRFYADDLVHPSITAINYIWERFVLAWVSPDALGVMKEADAIQKSLLHRPYNPESVQYFDFKEKLHQKIKGLQNQYPHISF